MTDNETQKIDYIDKGYIRLMNTVGDDLSSVDAASLQELS